jgi:hypothetical protein
MRGDAQLTDISPREQKNLFLICCHDNQIYLKLFADHPNNFLVGRHFGQYQTLTSSLIHPRHRTYFHLFTCLNHQLVKDLMYRDKEVSENIFLAWKCY